MTIIVNQIKMIKIIHINKFVDKIQTKVINILLINIINQKNNILFMIK